MDNQLQPNPQATNQPQTPSPVNLPDSNRFLRNFLIFFTLFLLIAGIGAGTYFLGKNQTSQTACTMEAKVCPDGTSVGRTGPKCEFAPCPTQTPNPTLVPTEEPKSGSSSSTLCIQVITPAKNNSTNECREFPTPCDVPQGWTKVTSCAN